MACSGAGKGCFAPGRVVGLEEWSAWMGGEGLAPLRGLSRRDAINKVFQNKVASTCFYCCFLFVVINAVYSVTSYLRVIWQNAHLQANTR